MIATLLVMCGGGVGVGILIAVEGRSSQRVTKVNRARREPGDHDHPSTRWYQLAGAAVVGVAVAVTSHLIAAGVVVATILVCVQLPGRSLRRGQQDLARLEATVIWVEMLRDTLSAAAGLTQSIVTTARLAPPVIRDDVGTLANRLAAGIDPRRCLLEFADRLDSATADLVVAALCLATTERAQRLGELLSSLAGAARDEVAAARQVEAARAASRTAVKTITWFSIAFATLLVVGGHGYLTPFKSATGQLVLLLGGGLFAGGLLLMARMASPRPPVRLFSPVPLLGSELQ
jgi:tight adherence protein B